MNRAQIRERDLWGCARCGSRSGLHVHHRRTRSQGGKDTFDNLVTLCALCHDWVHHNPHDARMGGWLLGHGSEPAEVAVDHFAWAGRAVLLNPDGSITLWQAP